MLCRSDSATVDSKLSALTLEENSETIYAPGREREFVGSSFHRLVDSIKGTFGGSSDESKDKRGHRGNESDANLDRI